MFDPAFRASFVGGKLAFPLCRLKPIDVSFMKTIHNKVNIVPVIAKADTLTKGEVVSLKQKVQYC